MGKYMRHRLDRTIRGAALTLALPIAAGALTAPGVAAAAGTGQGAVPVQGLVVASTTIVADLVRQVAGTRWDVTALVPLGADPHSVEPTPQDARLLARARVVVLIGAGLEPPAMVRLVRAAAPSARVVELAAGLAVRRGPAGQDGADDGRGEVPGHGDLDPHVWTSVPHAIQMVEAIRSALEAEDPRGRAIYAEHARAYVTQLQALDRWVRLQVERIPPERRLLVTNHETLRYFAREYGFSEVGAVIPSASSLAEPAAAEAARLVDSLRRMRVPALFVETTVSPALARRLAQEAGVKVVSLYSDSLGAAGSGADTYVGYIRTNVSRIVEAMAGGA